MDYKGKVKFFFLNQNFGENRTGVENASLLRARLFVRYLGIYPIIVTAMYNPRLNIQRKKLYDTGLLDKNCPIMNVYEHFQETITQYENSQGDTWKTNDRWIYKAVDNTKDYRIYDEDNNYVIYRKCDNNGLLIYNNIFLNKKKVRRDTYDANGILSRTQYLDPSNGQVYSESYYRTDGSVCIHKHFEYSDKKNSLSGIQITNRKGEIIKTFSSEYDFIAYAVQQMLDEKVHNVLLVDKSRFYYETLLRNNQSNVSKICMVHSSHLKDFQSDILKGRLNSNYNRIFEDLTRPDAVVLLTNRQKEHVEERFGAHDNLFVIPHSIEESPKAEFDNRIPFSAVYLARYSPEKQQDSLVRVFYKVVQKYPEAKLDLYGFGNEKEDKERIVRQIRDLGIEENISVNDFVDKTDWIYDRASLGILPSRVEGFSMFLLESISHGCPVVSYDIDYGPSDLIDQGINGYLVEANNEEEMARKIIDIFSDKEKLKMMSQASYKKAESFHPQWIAEKWGALIGKILKDKNIQD